MHGTALVLALPFGIGGGAGDTGMWKGTAGQGAAAAAAAGGPEGPEPGGIKIMKKCNICAYSLLLIAWVHASCSSCVLLCGRWRLQLRVWRVLECPMRVLATVIQPPLLPSDDDMSHVC